MNVLQIVHDAVCQCSRSRRSHKSNDGINMYSSTVTVQVVRVEIWESQSVPNFPGRMAPFHWLPPTTIIISLIQCSRHTPLAISSSHQFKATVESRTPAQLLPLLDWIEEETRVAFVHLAGLVSFQLAGAYRVRNALQSNSKIIF